MSEAEKPYTCGGECVGGHERLGWASMVKSIFVCLCVKKVCGGRRDPGERFGRIVHVLAAVTQVDLEGQDKRFH